MSAPSLTPVDHTHLPLWQSVREAYILTYRNLGYLFRISWTWVALMLPIGVAFNFALPKSAAPDAPAFSWDIFVAPLVFWPMLASVAVAWHRKLLANESWPAAWYLRFDGTAARYLALMLVTSFILFVPAYALIIWMERAITLEVSPVTVASMVTAALMIFGIGLYVATRLWLALPAHALEHAEAPLTEAWNASRGSVWRILVGSFLCTAPMWLLAGLSIVSNIEVPPTTRPIAYGLYQACTEILVTFLAGMPVVSFLSIAYRQLIGRIGATA